jgi:predicted aldo/keto reductase-like oxidoreductase
MRKVVLGKSGLEVSAVGFGGIPIQRVPDEEAVRVIRRALDLGVTFIDTASGYSDSQAKIGRAVEGRRDGLVLASKTGDEAKEGALRDVERSRRELRTDRIDLYQLHGVSSIERWERIKAPGGALEGLLEARDAGHVAHIGYTSHSREVALAMADDPVFETVQFPFNLVTNEPAGDLIPKARERGLGFIVMKPLCGGQYDNANFAFKFLNGYPDIVPIPGIERAEEIEEIVALVESGARLKGREKEQAEAIVAQLGKVFCRRCGYCQPCPHDVPIQTAMVFEGFVKRLPPERIAGGLARSVAEGVDLCIECGECEKKCPYELAIIETIHKSAELARTLAGS